MFGTKLRTWMEAHIVRPKKKKDRKKEEKGFDSNCNSPCSRSANRSPALHQVRPTVTPPAKNVDDIHLRAAGYTATVTSSTGTYGGAGSVNLSSPESAYSTGYSTDGTSPGASFPPEYYINIRTGTHYFQSSEGGAKGDTAVSTLAGNGRLEATESAKLSNDTKRLRGRDVATSTPVKNAEVPAIDRVPRPRPPPHRQDPCHRRTESYSADSTRTNLPVPSSIPPPLIAPPMQSPRQRSRIRTNPWLSANSSGSSTAGFKSRLNLDETSSSSGFKLTESSGSASDVNVNNPRSEQTTRKEYQRESLSAGRSPINQNWRISSELRGMEIRAKMPLVSPNRGGDSSSSDGGCSNSGGSGSLASSVTHSVRSSEDDVTLNEMMGKFDESYVYEKETDILSDSDPTDCEDCADSLSDIDTGRDGGDENDPFENDDFDYIDNGSFLDLDKLDAVGPFPNTGHCAYFTFANEPGRRGVGAVCRLRESFPKRSRAKDDCGGSHKSAAKGCVKRQPSARHKKTDEKQNEKRKKRASQRKKPNYDECAEETANLNSVLVERMLLTNTGFNQGSRSVGGTPICLRRKRHDVNENLSPMKLREPSAIRAAIVEGAITTAATTTTAIAMTTKRRSNSVSCANGNFTGTGVAGCAYATTFASEIALMEADKETDRKCEELILEAENILVNAKNRSSPVVPSPRKIHNGLANKRVELIKNTELNIELALSRSRNSQPELQSGSIKDLEHSSPKRQFAQPCSPVRKFMERNCPGGILSREVYPSSYAREPQKCLNSPVVARRTPRGSPCRSLERDDARATEPEAKEILGNHRSAPYDGSTPRDIERRVAETTSRSSEIDEVDAARWKRSITSSERDVETPAPRIPKDEGPMSSSSDSDDRCDFTKNAPLMMFRSIDMDPIREGSSYCPQSEPVKRKIYAGSATYGRIRKTLGEDRVTLRNSDGDTATDDTDDSRRSLRERIAQLRQERSMTTAEVNPSVRDAQLFQHRHSQLHGQRFVQTIEGLKRSLEDQSATLKQTCLVSNDDGVRG